MSLINLLTVGATLKGSREKGTYKLDSIGALPTFGAPKTTVQSAPNISTVPSPTPVPEAQPSGAAAAGVSTSPAGPRGSAATEVQPSNVATADAQAPATEEAFDQSILEVPSNAPRSTLHAPRSTSPSPRPKEPISEVAPPPQGSLFPLSAGVAPLPTNGDLTPREVPTQDTQAGRSPFFPGVGSEGTTGLPANALPAAIPEANPNPHMPTESTKTDPPAASPVCQAPASTRKPRSWIKRLANHIFFGRPVSGSPAATVQIELALQKVTVVRNDLRDDTGGGSRRARKAKANVFAESTEATAPRPAPWFNLAARFGKKAETTPAAAEAPGRERLLPSRPPIDNKLRLGGNLVPSAPGPAVPEFAEAAKSEPAQDTQTVLSAGS